MRKKAKARKVKDRWDEMNVVELQIMASTALGRELIEIARLADMHPEKVSIVLLAAAVRRAPR